MKHEWKYNQKKKKTQKTHNCKWTRNQIKWYMLPFQSAPKAGEGNAKKEGQKLCGAKIFKWKVWKGLKTRLSNINYYDRV